jgi:hypothetical protein
MTLACEATLPSCATGGVGSARMRKPRESRALRSVPPDDGSVSMLLAPSALYQYNGDTPQNPYADPAPDTLANLA